MTNAIPKANNAVKVSVNANDNSKCAFKNYSREAKILRGEILDASCKIEWAISGILASLHKHSQYHKILSSIQPQLGSLITALQKAIAIEFNLKAKLKKFEPLIPQLNEALEFRNLLAHADIKTATFENSDLFLLLSMREFSKGQPKTYESTSNLVELKKISQKLNNLTERIENLKQDW